MKKKENTGLAGKYTVTLTDREGRVIKKVVKHNLITNAYKKYALYQMMYASNLVNVTRANAGSLPSQSMPSGFGLYLLNEEVSVHANTFLPPYVNQARNDVNSRVTFRNSAGETTETTAVIIPVDSACAFDELQSENRFRMRYVKNTGSGAVAAIALGRRHDQPAYIYAIAIRDVNMPSEFITGTADYLLEHTAAATVLWKRISDTSQFAANLKTKQLTACNNASVNTNITAQSGGLVIGGKIFRAAKKSSSGSTYVVTVTYVNNWQSATAASTFDITFTASAAVNGTVTPVLVARPAQGMIDVFVAGGITAAGAELMRATVNVATLQVSIQQNNPVIPHLVSGYGTNTAQYMTGFYHDGKYYLPTYYNVNETGALVGQTSASYQEGIIIDSAFEAVQDVVLFRNASNTFNAFVNAEEILQLTVNTAAPAYIHTTGLVSATGLGTVINKTADQVLTVEYEFKIQ